MQLPVDGALPVGERIATLDILRGFALLARTAGLLGHLAEEQRQPIGLQLYADVERATDYRAP